VRLSDKSELESFVHELYDDEKFRAWGVSEHDLLDLLYGCEYPVKFSDILHAALSLSLDKSCRVIVHKNGHLFRCVDRIESEVPAAKFLFVYRDPRAVFNSQSKSKRSADDQIMQSDILFFALDVADARKRLRILRVRNNFLVVDYERLVADFDAEFERVLAFIGVTNVKCPQSSCYVDRIPGRQKALHQLVDGDPQSRRIFAWANELPLQDILFLNLLFPVDSNWRKLRLNHRKLDEIWVWPRVAVKVIQYVYASITVWLGLYPPPYLCPINEKRRQKNIHDTHRKGNSAFAV
jgi:hypothetical protein